MDKMTFHCQLKNFFRFLLLGILSLFTTSLMGQSYDLSQNVDDELKEYSLYFPNDFDQKKEYKMVVAFHPWNVERWNAKVWRDTLIKFANMNDVILFCPDGGQDGKVDDSTTLKLTDEIIQTILNGHNIEENHIYALGFSWGGKTVYSYAMKHPEIFDGYIPINAAISGQMEAKGIEDASGIRVYAIHGDQDAIGRRFTTMQRHLSKKGAIFNATILKGVGHTIDFEDRNQILTNALQWLIEFNEHNKLPSSKTKNFGVNPQIVDQGNSVTIEIKDGFQPRTFIVRDIAGNVMLSWKTRGIYTNSTPIETSRMNPGAYLVEAIISNGQNYFVNFWVR